MSSTPLVNLRSTMQQRPKSGSAAIGLLFELKGKSALPLGDEASVITGAINTIAKWFLSGLLLDQSRQSGWCRHNFAPT